MTSSYSNVPDNEELGQIMNSLSRRVDDLQSKLTGGDIVRHCGDVMNKSLPLYLPKVHNLVEEFR